MSKKAKFVGLLVFLLVLTLSPLSAQAVDPARAELFKLSIIVGAGVITLAVIAGAYGQAKAISSACEGISRNPAAGPSIRGILIFGLVLIETLVIYALLITIIILMVKWGAYS
ncbi:MAG: ATP synthase F0 subunit C [Candidatus Saccharicenans sp.]|nr:ATP synthase F0 subunit C [Candidatus Saccharicenans sp.]MDI6848198.1 ATP synthase F0 subunit C [Candidatus Saccharicenans sp.]